MVLPKILVLTAAATQASDNNGAGTPSYTARRLRLEKLSSQGSSAPRPGNNFHATSGGVNFSRQRGAFVIPTATSTVEVKWE